MHIHDINTTFTGRQISTFIEQHIHIPPRLNKGRNYTLRTTHTSSPDTIDANLFDMDMTSLALEINAGSQDLDESMLTEIDTFANIFGSFFKHQDYRRSEPYRIPNIRIDLHVLDLPDEDSLEDNGYQSRIAGSEFYYYKHVEDIGVRVYISTGN